MSQDCARAEVLAGAVALGEATETERDVYRRHLSGCERCIANLGGEREIERTMEVVAQAREAERWEPDVRGLLRDRARGTKRAWKFGFSAIAAAVVVSLSVHAMIAARVPVIAPLANDVATTGSDIIHISFEKRASSAAAASAPRPVTHVSNAAPGLVVEHTTVTLSRPPVASAPAAAPQTVAQSGKSADILKQRRNLDGMQVAQAAPTGNDEHSIDQMRTTGSTAPAAAAAESIAVRPSDVESRQVANVIRDAAPLGGGSAIVPHPSQIAYELRAEGTTAFDVYVDSHGAPVKCNITKSSGYAVLDVSVCRAAMGVKYSPRTVNGHAVAGIYHDAFTFRTSDNE